MYNYIVKWSCYFWEKVASKECLYYRIMNFPLIVNMLPLQFILWQQKLLGRQWIECKEVKPCRYGNWYSQDLRIKISSLGQYWKLDQFCFGVFLCFFFFADLPVFQWWSVPIPSFLLQIHPGSVGVASMQSWPGKYSLINSLSNMRASLAGTLQPTIYELIHYSYISSKHYNLQKTQTNLRGAKKKMHYLTCSTIIITIMLWYLCTYSQKTGNPVIFHYIILFCVVKNRELNEVLPLKAYIMQIISMPKACFSCLFNVAM